MKLLFWVVFISVVYTYLLYPGLLFVLVAIRRPFQSRRMPPSTLLETGTATCEVLPGASIIVIAYNEESVIEAKIKNCLELDYPRESLEIIIASDGSDDRTNEIVRRFSDKGVVLADYKIRRGKAEALNQTMPMAKNEIIVLSDANTFFRKDALKMLVRNFSDDRVGCVCGEIRFKNSKENKMGELEGFYWRYEVFLKRLEGRIGALLGANGGIYAIRKKLFEKIPANTIIDDFVIPMKILEKRYRALYEPEAIAYEETAKGIIQEMARRVRIGAGDFQSLMLTKNMLNPLRGFSALSFWSHKVLRWFAPFLLIGVLFFNAFLAGEKFYLIIFISQVCFYTAAIIGRISPKAARIKVFGICYYFVSMNIALLLGFFKFLTGTQKVMWVRTER